MASPIGVLARAIGNRVAMTMGFGRRQDYARVWDAVSGSETAAKIAVAGVADETEFQRAGAATRQLLHEAVGVRPDDVVLEIGCGVGRVGAAIAGECREWIGADVSQNMLEYTEQRLSAHQNVRTVLLNGHDLSGVASGSCDLVYCTVVFMHLDEWDRYGYVKDAMRVLKPGGRLLVDNIDLTADQGWALFEQHRGITPSRRPPHISKTSTPQELETYFRRAGFTSIQQRSIDLWIVTWGVKPAG